MVNSHEKLLELKLLLEQEGSNLTELGQRTLESLKEELQYDEVGRE
ncbi:MAG: hypothetical protein U9Q88_19525 [Bacillota bacterium]|jgi:hypothetical protein|nr:hypothetical protein [Bacillus sp. RO2]MEA3322189.1 hypothetical protein [Bacillota bacterium]NMH73734.1 hypothetical protein [Bacillus sp. RO2]